MDEKYSWDVESWKVFLEKVWYGVPKPFRSDKSLHRTLQCALYGRLVAEGRTVVADYLPPRADRPVDLVILNPSEPSIDGAVCFDVVISLYAVKSLSAFESGLKVIFTTGSFKKKVEESRFFLKQDIQHIHLEL